MKKILSLFIVCLLSLALIGCQNKSKDTSSALKGSAKGFKGNIEVSVNLHGHTIKEVKVLKHEETENIGTKAIEKIPGLIVATQSLDVDVVSGATFTSKGIVDAVKDALTKAKFDIKNLKKQEIKKTVKQTEKLSTDVVVIGAGGAGLVAAIELANNGKKVIVLEKSEMTGGNSVRATGGMNAAATQFQGHNKFTEASGVEKSIKKGGEYPELETLTKTVEKQYHDFTTKNENKYFDSSELFMLDTLLGGKVKNDVSLVKKLSEESSSAIDWLAGLGAKLDSVGSAGGAAVKRIHRPVNEQGKTIAVGSYLIPIFTKLASENQNVKIFYEAPAQELIVKDGAVVGVKAQGYEIEAKAVILASGGFGYNFEMVEKYKPELKGYISTNAPGITGDGIVMAEKAGAALVDMAQIQIHPTVYKETASLITEGLRGDGAILVNQQGKRFIDEVSTRDVVSAAEIKQEGGYAYLIIDQKMFDASAVIQGYVKKGFTKQADDIKGLAKVLKIDENTLETTLNNWNEAVKNKKDPEFNRTSFAQPLDKGPYYAIQVTPGIHHTMGGVKINDKAQVLNDKGQAISGLFAAGEVTGGVHGANRLGGNAVTDFVVYGRIAAKSAIEAVK